MKSLLSSLYISHFSGALLQERMHFLFMCGMLDCVEALACLSGGGADGEICVGLPGQQDRDVHVAPVIQASVRQRILQ